MALINKFHVTRCAIFRFENKELGETTEAGMVANKIEFSDRPGTPAYDAFISYNHGQDRAIAQQLQ